MAPARNHLREEILFSLAQTFYPLPSAEHHNKRAVASEDSGSTSDEAAHANATKKRQKKKKKGRTPSHVAKREEKKLLLNELAFLEARAAVLRQEAGIPDPKEVAATELQMESNRQLKETIQVQQNAMAGAMSAFAEFSTLRGHNPLESYIHMSSDTAARRSEVCALKQQHLQRAKQFLKHRMELVTTPNRPFHEESGYLTEKEHYVATKLDVHHFEGVQSVKQVFDALEFYFLNMEITTTELGPDLTVREDSNDLGSSNMNPMLHHRLVTMLSSGPMVEKNAIKFFQYYEDDDGEEGPYGIMAAAPVDEDDLYPYAPMERLRKDVSAAMKLSSFTRKKQPQAQGEAAQDEIVVVLTRWFRVKLHHSELKISAHVLQEVQRSVTLFTDHMVHSMNQSLYGAP
ncbi:hypothetical protein PHYPSEUDO_007825 [Phytophthora pseudosyringae]|uniref:Uncharacterized protein n=1 Tax=Phytophthora pseudosyringae TaxID=221518 RepID=A0A8T1VIN1_9STRA|nr:hypothetical protein PHYPSEUDO_007825 [Phytophthora pseudosyringae]